MKKIRLIIGVITLSLMSVGCSSREAEIDYINYIDESTLTSEEICIYINNFATILDVTADDTTIDTTQLTSEMANEIAVTDTKDYEIKINGELLSAGNKMLLELDELNHDTKISVEIKNDEIETQLWINTLHSQVNFTVEGQNSDDVYYYFDYDDSAVKTNNAGEVVFYKTTDFIRNFKRVELGDEVCYTYIERATAGEYDNIGVDGCADMRTIVMNSDYVVIDRLDFLLTDNGIHENHAVENHEFQMLGEGHYIVTAYVASDVSNVPEELTVDGTSNATVSAAVFQEIKDGELVFEFNSTNYPEFYGYNPTYNDGSYDSEEYQDYMHINSVCVDPKDNNYIVSLRNINAIVKVDHETAELVWILGGIGDMFGITDDQQFSRQHFARLSMNDTLTIFDNGVLSEHSRAIEFELDEVNMEIINFYSYDDFDYYGSIRGSTLRVDSNEDVFLSAWGTTQENNAIMTEYNYTTDEMVIEFYDHAPVDKCRNYRVHRYNN